MEEQERLDGLKSAHIREMQNRNVKTNIYKKYLSSPIIIAMIESEKGIDELEEISGFDGDLVSELRKRAAEKKF